jgi:enoyl-CoA hydratase
MSQEKIIVEKRGHLLLMGVNRPEKRNAFDVEMYLTLAAAFGQLHADRELRCGLIFASGDHFTSGLDL